MKNKTVNDKTKFDKINFFIFLILLITIICIVLIGILLKFINRNKISGVWELERKVATSDSYSVTNGVKKTTYTFNSDGKCNELDTEEGIKVTKLYNRFTKQTSIEKKPYSNSSSDTCTYNINFGRSQIKLFWKESYNMDLEEYYDCDWTSTCPEKPRKEDYIDKISIKIYDNYIFIDGEKYLKQ